MSTEARTTPIVPLDRLYPLSPDQHHRMVNARLIPADPFEPFPRVSPEHYHAMAQLGILREDDAVELIEGWLIRTMPINPPHRRASERAFAALVRIVPPGWYVTMQQPVTLGNSEPQPDLAIIRGTTDDYPDRHPGPHDLGLVIEVSNTSLEDDRLAKRRIYGWSGIPTYWIINLVDRQVEVHTVPNSAESGYTHREVFGLDACLNVTLDDQDVGRIEVRTILP